MNRIVFSEKTKETNQSNKKLTWGKEAVKTCHNFET